LGRFLGGHRPWRWRQGGFFGGRGALGKMGKCEFALFCSFLRGFGRFLPAFCGNLVLFASMPFAYLYVSNYFSASLAWELHSLQRRARRERGGKLGNGLPESLSAWVPECLRRGGQASPGVTPTEAEACPERSRMGVSPWSLLFVVCLSPICAFLCVLCGLCVETRRLISVAGPKGSFEGTGTPKGSNVKQGPQGGPTSNRDPKGVQRQTGRNRKTEIGVVTPEFPCKIYGP